jgi:hypothetical protein
MLQVPPQGNELGESRNVMSRGRSNFQPPAALEDTAPKGIIKSTEQG